jgi:hypothetical protein
MAKSDKWVPCTQCGQARERLHGPATITGRDGHTIELDQWHWARVCDCSQVTRHRPWWELGAGPAVQLRVITGAGTAAQPVTPARRAA